MTTEIERLDATFAPFEREVRAVLRAARTGGDDVENCRAQVGGACMCGTCYRAEVEDRTPAELRELAHEWPPFAFALGRFDEDTGIIDVDRMDRARDGEPSTAADLREIDALRERVRRALAVVANADDHDLTARLTALGLAWGIAERCWMESPDAYRVPLTLPLFVRWGNDEE